MRKTSLNPLNNNGVSPKMLDLRMLVGDSIRDTLLDYFAGLSA